MNDSLVPPPPLHILRQQGPGSSGLALPSCGSLLAASSMDGSAVSDVLAELHATVRSVPLQQHALALLLATRPDDTRKRADSRSQTTGRCASSWRSRSAQPLQ